MTETKNKQCISLIWTSRRLSPDTLWCRGAYFVNQCTYCRKGQFICFIHSFLYETKLFPSFHKHVEGTIMDNPLSFILAALFIINCMKKNCYIEKHSLFHL